MCGPGCLIPSLAALAAQVLEAYSRVLETRCASVGEMAADVLRAAGHADLLHRQDAMRRRTATTPLPDEEWVVGLREEAAALEAATAAREHRGLARATSALTESDWSATRL